MAQEKSPDAQLVKAPHPPDTGIAKLGEQQTREGIETILNALDALVYVSDMQTYELIFINKFGLETWGPVLGKKCYQYLQSGQTQPCSFCTNHKLVDDEGNPAGVHVWEFQNTVNHRWYHCRDQAIKWVDGRIVRLEIATDITEIKQNEERLEASRKYAEKLAMRDSLTGAGSRLAFYEHAKIQFDHLKRSGMTAMSLVMVDVDFFKSVNDRFGHATGDEALVLISETIQRCIRTTDRLFRIGGEEFVVVMVDCDGLQAKKRTDFIRASILEIQLFSAAVRVNLSSSFGISRYRPDVTIDVLLAEADRALYFAKRSGRNQSQLYSELPFIT